MKKEINYISKDDLVAFIKKGGLFYITGKKSIYEKSYFFNEIHCRIKGIIMWYSTFNDRYIDSDCNLFLDVYYINKYKDLLEARSKNLVTMIMKYGSLSDIKSEYTLFYVIGNNVH